MAWIKETIIGSKDFETNKNLLSGIKNGNSIPRNRRKNVPVKYISRF